MQLPQITRNQALGLCLIALISMSTLGISFSVGIQRAFATASPGVYTVTNVIYMNATGLGKSAPEVIRIEIGKSVTDIPWDKETPLEKMKGVGSHGNDPNMSLNTQRLQNIWESFEPQGDLISFAGTTLNVSQTQYYFGFDFKDNFTIVNKSEWLAAEYTMPTLSYPVIQKQILFDSPYDYAKAYCDQNGYIYRNIINSTYYKEYDAGTLNAFKSELVKEDTLITAPINTTPQMNYALLNQYGGSLQTKFIWTFTMVLEVIALIGGITAGAIIAGIWIYSAYDADVRKAALKENGRIADAAFNHSRWMVAHFTGIRNDDLAFAWAQKECGNITWSQYLAFSQMINGQYDSRVNNVTLNLADIIKSILDANKDIAGTGFDTSWTDWIMPLIELLVVCFAIFIVYSLFFKSKTMAAPASGVVVVNR